MSDPAVYNDHREAAEVGRRLKQLEGPVRARAALAAGAGGPRRGTRRLRARRDGRRLRGRGRTPRRGAQARARGARPRRREGRDRRGAAGGRRRRSGALGGRAAADAAAVRGAARVQDRAARDRRRTTAAASRKAVFAIKGDGAYSVFKFEGGIHRVQRVPDDRVRGSHPHLDGDGRRDAGGGGRRRRGRRERPEDRRVPLVGARAGSR